MLESTTETSDLLEETTIETTEESIVVIDGERGSNHRVEPIEEETQLKIPASFKTTAKPQILTEDDLEDFESKEIYLASIKVGDVVKLFKLTDPITDEPVLDRYRVQYEAIAYKGATMTRLYRDRLDANFKIIDSESFG